MPFSGFSCPFDRSLDSSSLAAAAPLLSQAQALAPGPGKPRPWSSRVSLKGVLAVWCLSPRKGPGKERGTWPRWPVASWGVREERGREDLRAPLCAGEAAVPGLPREAGLCGGCRDHEGTGAETGPPQPLPVPKGRVTRGGGRALLSGASDRTRGARWNTGNSTGTAGKTA